MSAPLEISAYWVNEPGVGVLATTPRDHSKPGFSALRALHSGVSPGTERLVGMGKVPESCSEHMACPYMEGQFSLPIKYGYDFIGIGVDGELQGRRVFVMHPHQSVARIRDTDALLLPDGIPSTRATLIPNLETALNAVWDGNIKEPTEVIVVGGGAVGLLVCYVLARLGHSSILIENHPLRMERAKALPWISGVVSGNAAPKGAVPLAFHCTGNPNGLQTALHSVGFEGQVIELSWYGRTPVTLNLGEDFHYQRKRIIASQVGSIATPMRGSMTHLDRLKEVLRLLEDPNLDLLHDEPIAFEDMPQMMLELYRGSLISSSPLIDYSNFGD